MIERGAVHRQAFVGPLLLAVGVLDDLPFADRLRIIGGVHRRPRLLAGRAGFEIGQQEATRIGTHEAGGHRPLFVGARRRFVLAVAGIAVAQIVQRPAIKSHAVLIDEHRAVDVGVLDGKARRKRFRRIGFEVGHRRTVTFGLGVSHRHHATGREQGCCRRDVPKTLHSLFLGLDLLGA